jgi:2-keto-4-pentenoate hydratase/2-oxohepta-3-ene-1,7-dioic acid hydratase in catechol pathway
MGRLIVRYNDGGQTRWGELAGEPPSHPEDIVSVAPLSVVAETTAGLISALDDPVVVAVESERNILARQLLSPVTRDACIYAQGLNYQAHAAEAQHDKRRSNLIFAKASSSLTGPFGDIERPGEVQLLDYEVEFGLVLRRNLGAGDRVAEADLGDAVAGIVLCNDVSARDTMFGTTFLQWFRGKSYRTFCPAGPVLWLLDRAEVAEAVKHLEIKLWVNGELRQQGLSEQLIWKPAETLDYIASSIDLRRGDLLLTGTPGGVTAPATPRMVEILQHNLLADEVRRDALRVEMTKGRPFLEPGDMVTATLADSRGHNLGGLANRVVEGA